MKDNLRIRQLKIGLIKLLNDSHLPIEVVRMVLTDVLTEVSHLAEIEIQKEMEEEQKESEEN